MIENRNVYKSNQSSQCVFVVFKMAVAMGRSYTLIVTETGTVFSCGQNRYGQFGLGSDTDE